MNRRDLDLLCRVIKNNKPQRSGEVMCLVLELSDAIKAETANFDQDKFLERCGARI